MARCVLCTLQLTVPPESVSAEQTDNQTVHVSWSAIPSDRQPYVESDVTYYEVEYRSVGGGVQEPINNCLLYTSPSPRDS